MNPKLDLYKCPIPVGLDIEGWEQVLIKENKEKLVEIKHQKIISRPEYFIQRIINSINKCYVRESVADLLVEATKNLPSGLKFIIFDAWRPIEVQSSLFRIEMQKIKKKNPVKKNDEIKNLTKKYVSVPSTNDLRPSPHLTGGAIDISVVNNRNELLDMGTCFDYFGFAAKTDYYESLKNRKELTKKEKNILQNRRLLYNLLCAIGFTNYPEEWWHFDYGNQFWGKLLNKDAIYGKIK